MNKLKLSVGAAAASILLYWVPTFEGMILRGYTDPIGIVTACAGHTKTAVLGRPYTKKECEELLQQDLVEHAEGVLECTPILKKHVPQLSAAISFAFNVGVKRYCDSTMARLFNEEQFVDACMELPKWVYAGGRILPGLVTRRETELALCMDGLKDVTST